MPTWITVITIVAVTTWIFILAIIPIVYTTCWGVMFCIWLGDIINKENKDE